MNDLKCLYCPFETDQNHKLRMHLRHAHPTFNDRKAMHAPPPVHPATTYLRCYYGDVFERQLVKDGMFCPVPHCGNSDLTPVPEAVINAIKRKFHDDPEQLLDTLNDLRYDSLMGCYYFNYAGMYHGVENDGYIHT